MLRTLSQICLVLAFLTLLLIGKTSAQHQHSPYAGQEKQEIKSLSEADVEGYLTGQGMGFGKAAELNHYPGPRHVLDMADQLDLSSEQVSKIQGIYDRMNKQAVEYGEEVVQQEQALDQLFDSQKISRKQMEKAIAEIAILQGKLRLVHLQAHLETKQVMTSKQVEMYDEFRGYQHAME